MWPLWYLYDLSRLFIWPWIYYLLYIHDNYDHMRLCVTSVVYMWPQSYLCNLCAICMTTDVCLWSQPSFYMTIWISMWLQLSLFDLCGITSAVSWPMSILCDRSHFCMTYNCIWDLNRIEIAAAIPNDFTQSYLYGLRDQNMILDGDETYLTPTTYNIHWVDTWWANGHVSPSQMAEQKCDL